MAVYGTMVLTQKGQALFAKAQTGTQLNFTRMQIGSGQLAAGQDPTTLTALINPIGYFAVNSISASGNTATIRGIFTNSAVTSSKYTCEIGIFAQDPMAGEILYAYATAGSQGDTIPPISSGPLSKQFTISVAIGNATSVTATVPTDTYIPVTDKGAAGGVAPLDSSSKVPTGNIPAITDTLIGTRTADPTQAPSGLVGTVSQWFSWIANRIKAIMGTTNWYDAPPITLTDAKTAIQTAQSTANAALPRSGGALTGELDAKVIAIIPQAATANSWSNPLYFQYVDSAGHTQYPYLQSDPTGSLKYNGTNRLWHDGNDGAGSGLDADTVRGYVPVNKNGDTMVGNLVITRAADSEIVLEDTSAPTTSYRQKQIFSSNNVGGGNDWLFRQIRPSDGAAQDFTLSTSNGSGTAGQIWHTGMLRNNNGILQFYTGGVWKPVAGYGSTKYKGSTSVSNTNIISITGTGRLNALKFSQGATAQSITVNLIVDGTTVGTSISTSASANTLYLNPILDWGTGSADAECNVSFESSLVVAVSGYTGTFTWVYEVL